MSVIQMLLSFPSFWQKELNCLMFFNVVPTCEKTSFNHILWSVFPSPYYPVTCYKFLVDLCVQLPCTIHLYFDFCGYSLCNTLKTFQFDHKPVSAIPCNGIIACSSHCSELVYSVVCRHLALLY